MGDGVSMAASASSVTTIQSCGENVRRTSYRLAEQLFVVQLRKDGIVVVVVSPSATLERRAVASGLRCADHPPMLLLGLSPVHGCSMVILLLSVADAAACY
jgi:hypothetical protein